MFKLIIRRAGSQVQKLLVASLTGSFSYHKTALDLTQLAEHSLPTIDEPGSNPAIGNVYKERMVTFNYLGKTKIDYKVLTMAIFLLKNIQINSRLTMYQFRFVMPFNNIGSPLCMVECESQRIFSNRNVGRKGLSRRLNKGSFSKDVPLIKKENV